MTNLIKRILFNRSQGIGASRSGAIGSAIIASLLFLILMLWHKQLTDALIFLSGHAFKIGPDLTVAHAYDRYHKAVIYGGTGIILFNLFNSIGHFTLWSASNHSQITDYAYLATKLLRWTALLFFTDIVLQNLGQVSTSLCDYSMRYQTIGAILGVTIYILYTFFHSRRGVENGCGTKNQL